MTIPKTTLILILLALGLGAFVYFHEIKGATQQQEVKEKQQQIFTFAEDDVQSLTVKTKNSTVVLERNPQSNNPKWFLKSPISEPANDAIVAYLMDLLVKGKSDSTVSIPANQLAEFGLAQPNATIDIKLKNQKAHQLILGKSDFNNRFVYAQANSPTQPNGNINVLLVSKDFANAVNREISEWQQPIDNKSTPLPSNLPLPTP
ncbi:DUF4340 domain-containing protein [Fortiea sp. LEGE XX443]|uniref:DUF4340 domain-containing protein n=1 Tax=Fortiea sp. LEGE XX443 TaxID=1828611 RepID=UPI00187ECFE9|nr:DUF4340 domain-containing protein [Fortiea sp. LEGE XX443]MBE9005430.1 DUF4340 domain-containing protein [Fortiea sp. LEGE XX443]